MPRHLQHLRRLFKSVFRLCPVFRREVAYLPVCGLGDAGEHIAQILVRVDAASAATFDDGVGCAGREGDLEVGGLVEDDNVALDIVEVRHGALCERGAIF